MIRTSEQIDAISAAWVGAARDMPNIAKAGTGNYGKYVPLEQVVETVRPILAAYGLAYIQGLSDGDKVVTITTRLIHVSGQWMEDSLTLPTGQNTAQAVGSAVTYGRRYSLMAVLGLAPEDDDGALASVGTPAPRKAATAPRKPTEDKTTGLASNAKVTWAIIELRKHGIEDKDSRLALCAQALGHAVQSMNDLTTAQVDTVVEFAKAAS